MAITKIRKIEKTPQKALDYAKRDKESEIVKVDDLDYVLRDKKSGNVVKLNQSYLDNMKDYITYNEDNSITFKTISTGINCSVENAHEEWQAVRDMSKNGNENVLQYDIYQNFGIELNPELAHQIGIEFAEKYLGDEGYQCIVCTHINTGKVHNHIQFNATNAVTLKKFHDCLETVNNIRRLSDELCEKYNLQVLEKTKNMNLVRYKKADGTIAYFEPTERKNNVRVGEYANKNDYRNTQTYQNTQVYKDNYVKMLRADIDKIVPYVNTYEELLSQLENSGYIIKDKTLKGEWRKHITFKFMTWEKGVRDSSLGIEYEREHLTKKIEKNKQKDKEKQLSIEVEEVAEAEVTMNEDYRESVNSAATVPVKRSSLETYIIRDTLNCRKKVQQQNVSISRISQNSRNEILLKQINENLKTLKFVESKKIKSFEQIQTVVDMLYEKRQSINEQMFNIGKMFDKIKDVIDNSGNYSDEKMKQLEENYKTYCDKYEQLQEAIEIVDERVAEYDSCIATLNRIDKNERKQSKYQEQIKIYYEKKRQSEKKNSEGKER